MFAQREAADFVRGGEIGEPPSAAARTSSAAPSTQPADPSVQPGTLAGADTTGANGAAVGPGGRQLVEMRYNTTVYVTGLPDDCTAEEVAEEFAKCGVVKTNDDGSPKVKLYRCGGGPLCNGLRLTWCRTRSPASSAS